MGRQRRAPSPAAGRALCGGGTGASRSSGTPGKGTHPPPRRPVTRGCHPRSGPPTVGCSPPAAGPGLPEAIGLSGAGGRLWLAALFRSFPDSSPPPLPPPAAVFPPSPFSPWHFSFLLLFQIKAIVFEATLCAGLLAPPLGTERGKASGSPPRRSLSPGAPRPAAIPRALLFLSAPALPPVPKRPGRRSNARPQAEPPQRRGEPRHG